MVHNNERNVRENYDLAIKQITTRMPSIHVRTGPIVSDPAASIATTTLYTTTIVTQESGHFRVLATLITTRAGAGGTASVTITWNNGSATQTAVSNNISLTILGNEVDFVVPLFSAAGQNITYATTVTASAGNPAYSLNIKLEFMS